MTNIYKKSIVLLQKRITTLLCKSVYCHLQRTFSFRSWMASIHNSLCKDNWKKISISGSFSPFSWFFLFNCLVYVDAGSSCSFDCAEEPTQTRMAAQNAHSNFSYALDYNIRVVTEKSIFSLVLKYYPNPYTWI